MSQYLMTFASVVQYDAVVDDICVCVMEHSLFVTLSVGNIPG